MTKTAEQENSSLSPRVSRSDELQTSAARKRAEIQTIDGQMIFWRDKQGFVHRCEGCHVSPPRDRTLLLWTLCERDVPANAAYTTDGPEFVTCATCAKAEGNAPEVAGPSSERQEK